MAGQEYEAGQASGRNRRWRSADRGGIWRRGRARRLLAAGCLGLAVWVGVAAARPQPPPQTAVVVAAEEIPLGAVLDPESVSLQQLPSDAVPVGALTDVSGAVERRVVGAVRPGEVITDARLASSAAPQADPGDPAGARPSGQESAGVMFVPVADGAVVAALSAGDRVDLIGADGVTVATAVLVTGTVPEAAPAGIFVAVAPADAAPLAEQIHPMASGVSVLIRHSR